MPTYTKKQLEQEKLKIKMLEAEHEYKNIRLGYMYRLLIPIGFVYFVIIIILLIFFKNPFKGGVNFSTPTDTNINQLENTVTDLQNQVGDINKTLRENNNSNIVDPINVKLAKLDTEEQALSDTILENPEKALTARLLRDKQTQLETEILDIKNNQSGLNSRLDSLITTLLAVPLGTVALSLLTGLIFYLFKYKKNKDL